MPERQGFHMSPARFREEARLFADWIAGYWERVGDLPVFPDTRPGATLDALPTAPPREGEPMADMLRDMDEVLLPNFVHWQSPNFFSYFAGNTSGPSVLGEMVSSALSASCFQWACNPAATELEMRVMDWLVEMLGITGRFTFASGGGGVIQDSSSTATLCAIVAARERAEGPLARKTAYLTSESHSSVSKGLRMAGFEPGNVRTVAVDDKLAMRPDELERMVAEDIAAGLTPCIVVGTLGTTSSTAIDPLPAMGVITSRRNIWLHVDAAMAGAAMICPEYRRHGAGLELADSFSFNPHKWLFTNLDCCCMFVADGAQYTAAFANDPEYLANRFSDSGEVVDYRNWGITFGRRMRALKLWFVIRHYGVEGLRHHLEAHIKLARELAEWIAADNDFELAADVPFNLVCFRHRGGEELNRELLQALNASGGMHLTHTRLAGVYTLRMHIGQTSTERRHVVAAWELVQKTAVELQRKGVAQ